MSRSVSALPSRAVARASRSRCGQGASGVDVVGRDRRHAAPVVDARPDQAAEGVRRQVGRGLNRHAGTEDQPGARDGPLQVGKRRVRRLRHPRARLGPEVLDDDLLQVPVRVVQIPQREQRGDALLPGLPDPDQDAGREGHRELPGQPDGLQARVRLLVGRAVMRLARLQQAPGRALQHQPLRRAHLPQREQLGARDDAGIGVRQQAGGVEDGMRRGHQVRHRRGMPQRVQLGAGLRIAQLGLVAQREQRLAAARRGAAAGHVDHLVERHVGPLAGARRLGERAVVAHVPAQLRERDEHLARVADCAPEPGVPQRRRALHERRQIGRPHQIQRRLA